MLTFSCNVAGAPGCRTRKRRRWIPVSMALVDPARVGMGAYRLSNDTQKHRRALETALVSGVQVIDTAASWGDGRSEQLIGEVLEELLSESKVSREEVLIVSKGGYLEGFELRNRQQQNRIPQNAVPFSTEGLYSLDPEFLKSQISSSLQRLRTDYVDYYLIQNPEVLLEGLLVLDDITTKEDKRIQAKQDQFAKQLEDAFAVLEVQCQSGRIRGYGISSNIFVETWNDNPIGIACDQILSLAQSAADRVGVENHNFKIIQMPANLLERSAFDSNGAFGWAKRNEIRVGITRPFNAYSDARNCSMRLTRAFPVTAYKKELEKILRDLNDNGMEDLAAVLKQCDSMKGEFFSIIDFQNTMSGSIMPYITELLKQKKEINAVLVSEANGFFDT
uniref:NADP-dependent oxidoreductase domain-containing protein n=1 Tax=Rhodosorus marinus TaxID=101924 RepID=A0A7S0G4H3_9RHOD|mmetsp:Transcript_24737/g.35633  ORF Transcript_24737/g.35633 Transcript_24737/m.35633 type:complete len:391 (+) Transcript_24737:139-1311(+)